MKKTKANEEKILGELRNIPIVQVACEKTGISRNTFYKWKRTDKKFEQQVEEAMIEGEKFVNDMSESQLLQLIKEKKFLAIQFWLRHRHPKFKNKLEVTAKIIDETLTQEQENVVRNALSMVNQNKYEREQ